MADDQGIPESVQSALFDFHDSISAVEEVLGPFFAKPLEETEANADPIQKAKLELMAIFSANSLHWMYLCTRGESPTEHPILDELTRIKKYMDRLKELEDRSKAPKLDRRAAKNFIRSALWEPSDAQEIDQNQDGVNGDDYAQKARDLVEQELSEVLKQYKVASTHKRWSQDGEEGAVAEVSAESVSVVSKIPVKESTVKAKSDHKRWSDVEEITDETTEPAIKVSKTKTTKKRKQKASAVEEITEETVELETVVKESPAKQLKAKKGKNKKKGKNGAT